jgi:tight adherence protein C
MPLSVLISYGLIAITALALGVFVFLLFPARQKAVIETPAEVHPQLGRIQQTSIGASLAATAPRGYTTWLEKQLVFAGRPAGWSTSSIITWKLVLACTAVIFGALFVFTSGVEPYKVILALLATVLLFFLPDVMINSRAHDRQEAITRALPDTLDQMTIAVEAGLGFDAAMAKAARAGDGPLQMELVRVLQDMSIGRTRHDAFREMERRTSAVDLRRFTRAIIQADAYGVAIGEVLRIQAAEMRLKRRQRAEEQAQKIAVKILFPLIFCLLPVMFIVILTPAVLGIIETFSK